MKKLLLLALVISSFTIAHANDSAVGLDRGCVVNASSWRSADSGLHGTKLPWRRWYSEAEFRVAYFYPTSERFREICPGARIDYSLEGTFYVSRHLGAFGSVTWLPKSGHSLGEHHRTQINLVPFTAGLRYRYCFNRFMAVRFGVGAAYYLLATDDYSNCTCIRKNTFHQNVGAVVKVDWQLRFCRCTYADLFVDYLYLPLNVSNGCTQVGGFNVGVGVGRRF